MRKLGQTLRRHPSAVLLAVQIASLLIYPYLGASPVGRGVLSLLAIAALVIAAFAVARTPALTWVSAVLGGPVLVLTVIEALLPGNTWIVICSAVLHCAFYLYAGLAFIRYMFTDSIVTVDELFATGATFTVVAWAFAYLYQAVQALWPGSFIAAVDAEAPRTWVELLFLSVTTMTSTGLSDIVPVRPQARSVVMIEQIAGMLYLALVVARVTALTVARSQRRREHSSEHDAVRDDDASPSGLSDPDL